MAGRRKHGFETTGRPFADLLATHMEARSVNLPRMAEMVRRAAFGAGERSSVTMSLVCKWRAGSVTPGPNHVRLVARALDLPVEVVATAAAAQRRHLTISAGYDPVARYEDHEMKRRSFLRHLALLGLAGTVDIEMVAAVLRGTASLDDGLMSNLERAGLRLKEQWAEKAPQVLLPAVATHVDGLRAIVGQPQPSSARLRLQAAAGDMAVFAASLCWFMQRRDLADGYLRWAGDLANATGHAILEAMVLTIGADFHSSVQLGGKDGSTISRSLLDAANDRLKAAPSVTRAWVLLRSAEEHAAAGQPGLCERSLDLADAALAAVDVHEPEMAHLDWNLNMHAAFRGNCAQILGRYRDSGTILQGLLARNQQAAPTNRASVQADLGAVYAQEGEVEGACMLLGEALDTAVELGLRERIERVRGIQAMHLARTNDHPAVRELTERLQALPVQN
jgi:hypothetical protein